MTATTDRLADECHGYDLDGNALSPLVLVARAMLDKLSNMTTQEFGRGGERNERRALAVALGLDPDDYSL